MNDSTVLCTHAYMQRSLEIFTSPRGITLRSIPVNYAVIKHEILKSKNTVCILPETTAQKLVAGSSYLACVPAVNFPLAANAYIVYGEDAPRRVNNFVADMLALSAEHFGNQPTLGIT